MDLASRLIPLPWVGIWATTAAAQPGKCIDEKGRARYIDQSMAAQENCKPVRAETNIVPMQPGAIAPRPAASGPSPAEEAARRQAAIKQAESGLAQAKQKLAEQEAIRGGDEHNYARVEERLKPYQEAVEAAEKQLEEARSKPRRAP